MTAPLWQVPFAAEFSDVGDIDAPVITTGPTWDGSGFAEGSLEGDSSFVGWATCGRIITTFSIEELDAEQSAMLPTPSGGGPDVTYFDWPFSVGPTSDLSDYQVPAGASRYSVGGHRFVSVSDESIPTGITNYYPVPDWRGQPGCPTRVKIKGVRLVPHVRGGPWFPSAVAMKSLASPEFYGTITVVGGMPAITDFSQYKASVYVLAVDTQDTTPPEIAVDASIVKIVDYDAAVGSPTAGVPSDVAANPTAFYWGYTSWQQIEYSGTPEPIASGAVGYAPMTGYNLIIPNMRNNGSPPPLYSSVPSGEWYPADRGSTEGGGPETFTTGHEGTMPAGATAMAPGFPWAVGTELADAVTYDANAEPLDIDIEIPYEMVAGRSILLCYPACVPFVSNDGNADYTFFVGFDQTANTDALVPFGLGPTTGQISVEIPAPLATTLPADVNMSGGDFTGVTLNGEFFVPAYGSVPCPGALYLTPVVDVFGGGIIWTNDFGSPNLINSLNAAGSVYSSEFGEFISPAPGTGGVFFQVAGPNITSPMIAHTSGGAAGSLPTLGTVTGALDPAGTDESEGGSPNIPALTPGATYHYRVVAIYSAISDAVEPFWTPGGFSTYPSEMITLYGKWVPFTIPIAPKLPLHVGSPKLGMVRSHRPIGHAGAAVKIKPPS